MALDRGRVHDRPMTDPSASGAAADASAATHAPPPPPPRQLRRNRSRGIVGGVAAGVADYFRVDPTLVRIVFVLTFFAGGFGVIAYVAGWILIPDGGTPTAMGRERSTGDDTARVAGAVLVILAALLVLGQWSWTGDVVLPLVLIGAGGWLLLRPRSEASTPDGEHPFPGRDPEPTAAPRAVRRAAPAGAPVTRITLAVLILVVGAFGLVAGFTDEVSVRAVLIACLAVVGTGLVAGAFVGRGRLLIPVGILLLAGLSFVSAVEVPLSGGIGERRVAPIAVTDVEDEYHLGIGQLVLDLRDLDAAELRRERLEIDVRLGVGSLQVLVPDHVRVIGVAEAELGDLDAFDRRSSGAGASLEVVRPGLEGAGVIELDLRVGLGEVVVR